MNDKFEMVSVVAGGTGSIGSAIIAELRAQGHTVINVSLNPSEPALRAVDYDCDLLDCNALESVLADILRSHSVTGLVNNVHYSHASDTDLSNIVQLQALSDLQCCAAIQCIEGLLPSMCNNKYGRIVNIGNRMILGRDEQTYYSLVESGLFDVTQRQAIKLAAEGITVNMVSPGPIETLTFHNYIKQSPADANTVIKGIPVGRIGEARDVSNAVGFFIRAESDFVTGQNLYVCGGGSVGGSVEAPR